MEAQESLEIKRVENPFYLSLFQSISSFQLLNAPLEYLSFFKIRCEIPHMVAGALKQNLGF
jgi:hypothetical protein